ncbi:hypothetical protein BGZ95_010545 [Linnemannia exigua]|uniref:SAP domain-containing protein n=1 Tax=Linnemannia exigua TaxID=604196 RepID=A0AAD4H729_9FUNG|nr:hypothetical protein BGZ95_010545 [Linnemannia exigua]
MSVVPLSRRRKAELKGVYLIATLHALMITLSLAYEQRTKSINTSLVVNHVELASNLGLSEDGVREDIVERIKAHIATSNDPSLRALIRDDSPDDTTTTTTTTTYTTNPNSASASGRSSPRKKTTTVVTKETRTSSSSKGGARRGSHSHSHTEDELEEREVRGFMEHMQGELHEARDLAQQLEETLHAKFTTGNSSQGKSTVTTTTSTKLLSGEKGGRRGSKDHHDDGHSSFSRHENGHSSSHHREGEHPEKHLLRSSRLRHGDGDDDDEDEEGHHHNKHAHHHRGHHGHHHGRGWGWQTFCSVKNHLSNVCQYTSKPWTRLQDLGSTSRGYVWLTLLLELGIFLSQAYAYHKNSSGSSCSLGFLTNWPNFLQPFFSYYGTFFLIPTLLSQLFNVDRSRASSSASKSSLTGLLSKHTTSALSYFVFKFALTYFLGHSIGLKSLLGTALPAGARVWSGCKYISDIFRYVPQALGLATSGAGTVLSLAESIVQSQNNHR